MRVIPHAFLMAEGAKMVFLRKQIVTLRKRFDEYRDNRSRNPPSALSLEAVLLLMRSCPTVNDSFFARRTSKVLNEHLRRFVNHHNTSDDTLEAIKQFLTYEDHLLDAELQDPEYGEMLAVQSYMASGSKEAQERFDALSKLKGSYVARPQPQGEQRIELEFEFDAKRMLIHVTEFYHWPAANDPDGKKKKGSRKSVKSVRIGYGFLGTNRNLLHIFVKGGSATDRIHYLEVDVEGHYNAPMLMRTGGIEDTAWADSALREALKPLNIHRFANNGAEGRQEPELLGRWPTSTMASPWISGIDRMTGEPPAGPDHARDQKLIEAVRTGAVSQVQHALAFGANPNWPDAEKMTALHHAAALGMRPCVRLLVKSGRCDYLLKDAYGRYASDLAIEWSTDHAVARLLGMKRRRQAFEAGRPARTPRGVP